MPVNALYGGIPCRSASMSLTQGITPDVGTLVIPTWCAGRIPAKADLVLSDGNDGLVRFLDMYHIEGTEQELPGGREISIQIADRRCLWKWNFLQLGQIAWNQPNPDGTAKKERALVTLLHDCLSALSGARWQVMHDVPEAYPPVRWPDPTNAAAAAQALCDEFGLGISLAPWGSVNVESLAADHPFPPGPVSGREAGQSVQMKPASIWIIGSNNVYEKTFSDLVAVGIEIDGTVRPIDELSYKPAHGWGAEPLTFPNLAAGSYGGENYTADEARELARKAVWKWYSLKNADRAFLPLLDVRSELVLNQGVKERGRPYVLSELAVWDGTVWVKLPKQRISEGFTLDCAAGIVKFDEPIYTVQNEGAAAGAIIAPDMDLRAAYESSAPYGFEYIVAGGVPGTALYHSVPALRLWWIDGDTDPFAESDMNDYARKVAEQLARPFSVAAPESRTYPRITAIRPGGTIRAVRWSVDGQSGAMTRVEKGFDLPDPGMPAFEERLARRKTRVVLERLERQSEVDAADESMGLDGLQGEF